MYIAKCLDCGTHTKSTGLNGWERAGWSGIEVVMIVGRVAGYLAIPDKYSTSRNGPCAPHQAHGPIDRIYFISQGVNNSILDSFSNPSVIPLLFRVPDLIARLTKSEDPVCSN